jgi:transposase
MSENHEVQVRRPRSAEEVERLVVEFEASGAAPSDFCRDRQLARSVLYRSLQKRRLGKLEPKPSQQLVAVSLVGTNRHEGPVEGCPLEVVLCSGRRIAVRPNFDSETLERLVNVLEGA